MKRILPLMMLAGCGKPAAQSPSAAPTIESMAELGALMKNEINPAFSRLTFLLYNGETVEEDPKILRAEINRNAVSLRQALTKLASWQKIPAKTPEGREVFVTYAESVDTMTQKLVSALDGSQQMAAETQMELIADTCNNCHHFFRLDIEDSVVPGKNARTQRQRTALVPFHKGVEP